MLPKCFTMSREPETVIGIFCYKRTETLKATIHALLKNTECADMEAVFFCDGYKGEADKQDVLTTREYIKTVTGFKRKQILFREKNYNAGPNIYTALIYLTRHYQQFIIIEDDVVVTPNCIRFLLDALTFYKDDSSVFSITGYCFPLHKPNYPYDSVVHKRFCSYGWASWSDRVANVKWDTASLQHIVDTTQHLRRKLNRQGMDLYPMLRKQISNRLCTYDVQIQLYIALHNLHVIFPLVSKIDNRGFDAAATNKLGINYLKTPLDTSGKKVFRFCKTSQFDKELSRQLRSPYSLARLGIRKVYKMYLRCVS